MALALTLSKLPVVGAVSYGGFRFEELLTSKMTGRPEWDRARRSVKYIRYTLEVDGYVIAENSSPNDPLWSQMRYVLQQPGLRLTYSDRGFSKFTVDQTDVSAMSDVCNGPHPELLEFIPLGARLAARVVWKCAICLPEIKSGSGRFQSPFSRGILAFNWSTNLKFGDDGYADYSVKGELEIARVLGRRDNLENYRAYTEPQLPAGFKPTERVFDTDDAKSKIQFYYSFHELPPMGIPINCTRASGSYRVANEGTTTMTGRWTASLRASYVNVPRGPRREVYMRFLGLLRDRLQDIDTFATGVGIAVAAVAPGPVNVAVNAQGNVVAAAGTMHPIIRKFTISEGLYEDSHTNSFECSWTMFTSFRNLFQACGAWRRMADCAGQLGTNGKDVWVTNMASIVGYTSWYDYGFRPQAEVVVSPNIAAIGPITPVGKGAMTGPTFDQNSQTTDDVRACTAGAGLTRFGVDPDTGASPDDAVRIPGLPSPEESWLNYQLEFITDLDPGMAIHKPLPQTDDPVDTLGAVDIFGVKPENYTKNGVNTNSSSSSKDVVQRMATSTYRVALRGFGTRAGYKVPVPDLKVFGGSAVTPGKQRVIGPPIIANYSGIPIYMTAWVLWYEVPVPPKGQQKTPPNLAQRIGDVANPPTTIPVPVTVPEPPIQRGRFPTAPIVPRP